ncbi:hypothetical protein GOBAR_DD11218 [Gossypium barbadense]|nr:hypothetical protein GOBAR_DD11218 [Gossypium barbadense]
MAIATMTTPLPISLFPFLLLIPAICFTICHANINLLCIQSEREALLKFKNHLIDPSNRLSSWVEGGDCCEWIGVFCQNSTGHVHQLHLAAPPLPAPDIYAPPAEWEPYKRSKLRGRINPSLLELKHLSSLDLSNNNFSSIQIPKFFGLLESLTYLNLSRARFQGAIPHNLGNLSKLQYLDLRGNDFKSKSLQWVSGLSSLQYLDLSSADLSEAKSLQWVSGLSSLQYLDLSSADLYKANDWVQVALKLPSLLELHLTDCGLEDDPSSISVNSSKSPLVLDLSWNSLSSVPKWILSLHGLVSIDLGFNSLKGPIPYYFGNFSFLEVLDLSGNYLNSSVPNSLYSLKHLRYLDLSINEIEQDISEILQSLSSCCLGSLESLNMKDNQLSGHLTDQLGQFKNLAYLSLAQNKISGPIPLSIGELSSLKLFDVSENQLSGTFPPSLGQLSNLETLSFGAKVGSRSLDAKPRTKASKPSTRSSLMETTSVDCFQAIHAAYKVDVQGLYGDVFRRNSLTCRILCKLPLPELAVVIPPPTLSFLELLIAVPITSLVRSLHYFSSSGLFHFFRTLLKNNSCPADASSVRLASCISTRGVLRFLTVSIRVSLEDPTECSGIRFLLRYTSFLLDIVLLLARYPSLKLHPFQSLPIFPGKLLTCVGWSSDQALPVRNLVWGNLVLPHRLSFLALLRPDPLRSPLHFDSLVEALERAGPSARRPRPSNRQLQFEVCFTHLCSWCLLVFASGSGFNCGVLSPYPLPRPDLRRRDPPSRVGVLRFCLRTGSWLCPDRESSTPLPVFLHFRMNICRGAVVVVVASSVESLGSRLMLLTLSFWLFTSFRVYLLLCIDGYLFLTVTARLFQKGLPAIGLTQAFPMFVSLCPHLILLYKRGPAFLSGVNPKSIASVVLMFTCLDSLLAMANFLSKHTNFVRGSRTFGVPSRLMKASFHLSSFRGARSLFELVCHSSSRERMEVLFIDKNLLTGEIPDCWNQLESLTFLNLGNNNLTGKIPPSLGRTGLDWLNLRNNSMFGELPSTLQNLTNLRILDLSENHFSGNIPTWIGDKLSTLMILSLRSNNFDGQIPHKICDLQYLQNLDLSRNNILGAIPKCFSNLSAMANRSYDNNYSYDWGGTTTLIYLSALLVLKGREDEYSSILGLVTNMDLSANSLTGEIPKEIGILVELRSLNLSGNLLTGNIPDKIGNMELMESLDLSMNQLNGEIPPSFSNLNFLNHFNVSYNNLTGQIPTSTQLQSFENFSYMGNYLCGPPLTKNCSTKGLPTDVANNGSSSEGSKVNWLYVSIVLGFIMGFWGVVAPLFFIRSWRHAYYRKLDHVGRKLYVYWATIADKCRKLVGEEKVALSQTGQFALWDCFDMGADSIACAAKEVVKLLDVSDHESVTELDWWLYPFDGPLSTPKIIHRNLVSWTPSPVSKLKSDVNGSAWGKPCPAGCGGILRDYDGHLRGIFFGLLGHLDSNIAECATTLRALWWVVLGDIGRIFFYRIIIRGCYRSAASFSIGRNWQHGVDEIPLSFSNLNFLNHFNMSCNNLTRQIPTSTQLQSFEKSLTWAIISADLLSLKTVAQKVFQRMFQIMEEAMKEVK